MVTQKHLIVGIAVLVALLHFPIGSGYAGPWRPFVTGYLIDILLPFAMYLLLGTVRVEALRHWWVRAWIVFAVGATSEMLQYFGLPIFGQTFDPLDFAAFAVGVLAGHVVEELIVFRLPVGRHD
ncbi:MAG: DUF2809 domain-containing protein [Acidobacteria bacterium]|jgi:hypothetical protein|nr:DUF2809 domain-containing protein [Acidobacteriota bacterium]